jgi:hypothetical protein
VGKTREEKEASEGKSPYRGQLLLHPGRGHWEAERYIQLRAPLCQPPLVVDDCSPGILHPQDLNRTASRG